AADFHDPQFRGDGAATAHDENKIREERSQFPGDDEDKQLSEGLRLPELTGPNVQLHHHRNPNQHRHDEDEPDRLHTREKNLPREDAAHRSPPTSWLRAEEKRRAEHRGQILRLAPLRPRETAQAAQYFL